MCWSWSSIGLITARLGLSEAEALYKQVQIHTTSYLYAFIHCFLIYRKCNANERNYHIV